MNDLVQTTYVNAHGDITYYRRHHQSLVEELLSTDDTRERSRWIHLVQTTQVSAHGGFT